MQKQCRQIFKSILLLSLIATTLYSKSAILLNDNEKAFLQKHPVITVHNEKKYPPYNFNEHGQAKGLSIDYMNLLATKLGLRVKYVSGYEWSEFMTLIQNDELDVMLNIMRTPKREKYLHFTEPYAATMKAIFSNTPSLNTLHALDAKMVCVPKDFYIEHFLEAYHPEIMLIKKRSTLACIQSVKEGSSDATVGSYSIINDLMRESNMTLSYAHLIPDKRLTVGLSIATAPHLKLLREILQKAMYSISEDELTALMKKWIGSIESKKIEHQIQSHVKPFKKQRVITMCNNPDWAPIEFAKGGDMSQMQGIAIDTLRILEKKLNVLFETVPTKSWSQSQAFLREGKCDILPAAIATKKRKAYANFTTPYLVYRLAIITKINEPFIDSLDDISDKKIARKKGSGLISKLKTLYPHIHIIETKDYIDSLKKVSSGEVYCTIATLPVASHFINKYALKNLKIAGYTDMRYRLSIAVNRKDKVLLPLLNKALQEITQEQQNYIYSKWVNNKLVESFDYRYLLYPAAMVLLIMLLLMYRQNILKGANKNLQKEIKKKVDENFIQYQFIQEQTKFAAMGEMIGVIAHQWRQPLNALGLSVQNLEYHYKDGLVNQDFVNTYIDKNIKTIKFMSQTIDDFRGFFKVDKVKENFSIKESIEATFYMQSLYLEKYHISFVVTGEDFEICGFKSEFQQVILNLISNAKDALLEHGGSERGIEVYLEDRIVVFMDNGGGIAEEIMGKVFDSYFTTKEEGIGVGLYMSKIIIEEKMRGKISVYSKGDGTVVLLDFNEDQHEK